MINTTRKKEIEQTVRTVISQIDSSLQFVRPFKEPNRLYGVFQADLNGIPVVVKYQRKDNEGLSGEDIERERKALELLDGVERIPRLVETYETDGYSALAKTFVGGKVISPFKFFRRGLYCSGMELLELVHERGVADLDLVYYGNYLVQKGNIWFFDFNTARFRKEGRARSDMSERVFDRLKQRDIRDLERHLA